MDPSARSSSADRIRLPELEEETHPAELSVEKDQLQGRLDQYTYPVLTLPNEIVTEIFIQYLPPYPDFPPLVGPGSPTHLLGICRLWRSIALHSPELWRAIELRCKVHPNRVGLAEAWLQRSGASPLSVHLDFESNWGFTEGEDSLLNAVVAHRSRWEYIDIKAPPGPSTICLISGSSPSLVRLNLSTRWEPNRDNISFHHAHRLRSVCLWNVGYNPSSLPWGQLTSIALLNAFLFDCASILHTAANLVRCKLYLRGDIDPGLGAVHCRLPRLEILVLQGLFNEEGDYLAAFTLPSLRKLEILDSLLGLHAIEQIQSFLSRSACRLERLRIICDLSQTTQSTASCRIAFPNVVVDDAPVGAAVYESSLNDDVQWKTDEYWDVAPVLVQPS